MGRKGVSKRKPSQTKSKPMSSGTASSHASPAVQADDAQVSSTVKGGQGPAADWKKKPKKG